MRRIRAVRRGDLIGIPLLDARWIVATCDEKHEASVLSLSLRLPPVAAFPPRDLPTLVVAKVMVFGGAIATAEWAVAHSGTPANPGVTPTTELHDKPLTVGSRHYSSTVVDDLANALAGLAPWDSFYPGDGFDRVLLPGIARPACAWMTADRRT